MSDTHSIATRDPRAYEILRTNSDAFDTSDLAVVDLFLINTGFGIVTYELVRMASHSGLAEPDLNFARCLLVFGGLAIGHPPAVINDEEELKILMFSVLTIFNLKSGI